MASGTHLPSTRTKRLLGALNETTEFTFDFTEDVNDFNRANLEQYDLLFFANSTLRVDEPTEDAVGYETVLKYQPGDWRNYDAVLKTDQRDIKGRIALSGKPGELSGMADFGAVSASSARLKNKATNSVWSGTPLQAER